MRNWPMVISIVSLLIAFISAAVSCFAVYQAGVLQENQWERNEIELKRDVLRRLVGHRYVLTPGRTDPSAGAIVALNETWVVFADHPDVLRALRAMHQEEFKAEHLSALVKAMAQASGIDLVELDDYFIEHPFMRSW